MKYAIVEDGLVVNTIEWDGQEPLGDDLTPMLVPEGLAVDIGTPFVNGEFQVPAIIPAPPIVMTEDQAKAERDLLMAYATAQIAPLQDAVEMDEATSGEVASLAAWKKYRLAVSRTNTSSGWPSNITWPETPQ